MLTEDRERSRFRVARPTCSTGRVQGQATRQGESVYHTSQAASKNSDSTCARHPSKLLRSLPPSLPPSPTVRPFCRHAQGLLTSGTRHKSIERGGLCGNTRGDEGRSRRQGCQGKAGIHPFVWTQGEESLLQLHALLCVFAVVPAVARKEMRGAHEARCEPPTRSVKNQIIGKGKLHPGVSRATCHMRALVIRQASMASCICGICGQWSDPVMHGSTYFSQRKNSLYFA